MARRFPAGKSQGAGLCPSSRRWCIGKIVNDKVPGSGEAALQDDDGENNVNTALSDGIGKLAIVPDKTRFYERRGSALNARQGKVIARVFAAGRAAFKGGLSAGHYVAIAQCAPAAASRDLAGRRDMGALIAYGRGRGARYETAYPAPRQTAAWSFTRATR